MITTEITLILVALVLVAFEVILPGGILGILAAVCILLATGLVYVDHGLAMAAATFFGAACATGLLIYIEFKLLAKTTLGQAFFLKNSVTGHTGPVESTESLVGKSGKTLTRLNPSGKVAVEGKTYDASSIDGYLNPGETISVVDRDTFKLIIKKS